MAVNTTLSPFAINGTPYANIGTNSTPYTIMGTNNTLLSTFMNDLVNSTLTTPLGNGSYADDVGNRGYTGLFKAMCVLAGVFFLPGVFGNSLIIAMTCKYRKLRIPTNYFICSLAIADLMVMVVMVTFIWYLLTPEISIPRNVNQFLFPSLDIFVGSASIFNVAAVSIDRAIAVVRPLRYASLIHDRAAGKIISFTWVYSAGIFCLSMLRAWITNAEYRLTILTMALILSFLIPCTIILVCYVVVLLSALRNIKFTKTLERAVLGVSVRRNEGERKQSASTNSVHRMKLKELRLAMNIVVIVAPFTIGWGFFFGSHWYELFTSKTIKSDWHNWFLYIIPWLISSINPVVYILLTRQLRNCCYEFFCRKAAQRRRQGMLLTMPSKQATEHEHHTYTPHDSSSEEAVASPTDGPLFTDDVPTDMLISKNENNECIEST